MKKTSYPIIFGGIVMMTLSSCSGHKDYDSYVETLKAQPAVIDTISSRPSYINYLDSLDYKAKAFDQLGVKLDQTQKDEIATLSNQIQEALAAKYSQLTQQQPVLQ